MKRNDTFPWDTKSRPPNKQAVNKAENQLTKDVDTGSKMMNANRLLPIDVCEKASDANDTEEQCRCPRHSDRSLQGILMDVSSRHSTKI